MPTRVRGMGVHINPDGLDRLFQEIARKIEKVDADIRAELAGKPAAEVAPIAAQRFSAVGVNLTPSDIDAYAVSVEKGENFQINLQ